jgi:hypothetical protein
MWCWCHVLYNNFIIIFIIYTFIISPMRGWVSGKSSSVDLIISRMKFKFSQRHLYNDHYYHFNVIRSIIFPFLFFLKKKIHIYNFKYCHLLCGFWEKKHEYVHVVYKMLLINRAPFSAYDITTLHKNNIANKVQLPLFFPLFHFYHKDSKA